MGICNHIDRKKPSSEMKGNYAINNPQWKSSEVKNSK